MDFSCMIKTEIRINHLCHRMALNLYYIKSNSIQCSFVSSLPYSTPVKIQALPLSRASSDCSVPIFYDSILKSLHNVPQCLSNISLISTVPCLCLDSNEPDEMPGSLDPIVDSLGNFG